MNKTIYKQHDSRWASLPYPSKKSKFGGHGCGCVACVHVAIEQEAKKNWTPKTLRPYMVKKGYASEGHGTTWQGINNTLLYIGHKKVVWVKRGESMNKAWTELNKGNRIGVILFNSNKAPNGVRWTSGGHYCAFTGYKVENGKHYFYMKDSGPRDHDGWFIYENSLKNCVSQLWIVERVGTQVKPYKITKPYTGKLPSKTVKKGSKGADVKALQTFLNWALGTKLKVDGKAGSKTVAAIKKFQKAQGLTQDGKFGSKSKAKAQALIKKYAK